MLNPVIIDDEIHILRGLEKLIDWPSLGYENPVGFTDPVVALEYICRNECNVVITDICMPELSGHELIERILTANSAICIIVISSYSDFEYVQKALIYGVKNYILKPIHEDELSETLIRIRQEFIRDESLLNASASLQKQLFSHLANGYSYRLLPIEKALCRRYAATSSYQLLLVGKTPIVDSDPMLRSLLFPLTPISEIYLIQFKESLLIVLIRFKDRRISHASLTPGNPGKTAPFIVYTGILNDFDILYDHVCLLRRRLICCQFLYSSDGGLVSVVTERQENLAAQRQVLNKQISIFYERLREKLVCLAKKSLEQEYQHLADVLRRECQNLPPETIIIAYRSLLRNLMDFLAAALDLDPSLPAFNQADNEKIASAASLDELTRESVRLLIGSLASAEASVSPSSGGIVGTVELFIRLNYQQPLTLNSVASHFHFNPSYLSFLFSKGGRSFLSCINDVRLEKGAALLQKTNNTISAIASRTGFHNEKTFYKAFRSKYGCTPTQYRQAKH